MIRHFRLPHAFGAATVLHGAALSMAMGTDPPHAAAPLQFVELELMAAPQPQSATSRTAPHHAEPLHEELPDEARALRALHATSAHPAVTPEPSAPPLQQAASGTRGPAGSTEPVAAGSAAHDKPIHLFPGADTLSGILTRDQKAAPSEAEPELWQDLHARDAARGVSPASPAVAAGYRSARLAPREGTVLIEVRVDAQGKVTLVRTLGRAGADWQAVAADLREQLQSKVFRLPAGASGMVLQLRIDRGTNAIELSERGRVKPGVALGQEPPPRGIVRDDSARASFEEKGRISPAGRVGDSAWLQRSGKTRVRLESLSAL